MFPFSNISTVYELQQNSDTLDNYASDCHEMQGTPCPNDSEVSSVEQVREIERDVSNLCSFVLTK